MSLVGSYPYEVVVEYKDGGGSQRYPVADLEPVAPVKGDHVVIHSVSEYQVGLCVYLLICR